MPKEWNTGFRLDTDKRPETENEHEQSALIRSNLEDSPFREVAIENEVELNDTQLAIVNETRAAIRDVCEELELPAIDVPLNRIHVVYKGEFRHKISAVADAQTTYGHVYIAERRDGPIPFARIMTHELAHAASYFEVEAHVQHKTKSLNISTRRLGTFFGPKPKWADEGKSYFNGLNEGVTELLASQLRKGVARKMDWNEHDRYNLFEPPFYEPQVLLVRELINFVASEENAEHTAIQRVLLSDYLAGTFDFLTKLGRLKKRSVKILADMDTSIDSALRAAESLDLTDCAARIRELRPCHTTDSLQ